MVLRPAEQNSIRSKRDKRGLVQFVQHPGYRIAKETTKFPRVDECPLLLRRLNQFDYKLMMDHAL